MSSKSKYKRKSALITAGIQVILLVALFLIVAWRETYPPLPEYGIEIDFGLEEIGGGQQPTTSEPVVEEDQEQDAPIEDAQTEENPAENIQDVEQTDQKSESDIPESEVVEDEQSPDEVDPPDATTSESAEEASEPEEVTNQAEDEIAPEEEVAEGEGQTEETDDQGDPESKIDERALYEKKGSSDGPSLEMTGWQISEIQLPDDQSDESGKIVFEIKVDEDGYIIAITTRSSTVSPVVERKYRRSVENLILEKTAEFKAAAVSEGTITFILKSK